MKIAARAIDGFLARPDASLVAVLVYGVDQGLVAERADALLRTRVPDLADPFCMALLTGDGLKADPARLSDEARAQSLTGGDRAVRVSGATDALAPVFQSFLDENDQGGALVVVESGPLGPRAPLRKLFEGATNAAALPCYEDDARSLAPVIRDTLAGAGLGIEADAVAYLAEHLGGDRAMTRSELDKLILYMGTGAKRVTLADAAAAIGDSAGLDVEAIGRAAASGDYANLDSLFGRATREGVHPVQIIRAAIRYFQRLHLARSYMDADGLRATDAMKKLRPPPIFKIERQLAAQLSSWNHVRLSHALALLTETEIQVKSTGMPVTAVAQRAFMRIAGQARKAA